MLRQPGVRPWKSFPNSTKRKKQNQGRRAPRHSPCPPTPATAVLPPATSASISTMQQNANAARAELSLLALRASPSKTSSQHLAHQSLPGQHPHLRCTILKEATSRVSHPWTASTCDSLASASLSTSPRHLWSASASMLLPLNLLSPLAGAGTRPPQASRARPPRTPVRVRVRVWASALPVLGATSSPHPRPTMTPFPQHLPARI